MTPSSDERQSGLVLPWGWLSLGLCIVTITALGTLAVIAKKQGADSLSTIALALAILSFAAQLIVALAQAYNGSLQLSQAARVNADTISSLSEIRATSNALLSNQSGQFDQVLKAALKVAVPAAVEDVNPTGEDDDGDEANLDTSSSDLEQRILVRLQEELGRPTPTGDVSPVKPSPESQKLYQRLRTFPSQARATELYGILKRLSPIEVARFARNAALIRERAKAGRPTYILVGAASADEPTKLASQGGVDLGLSEITTTTPTRDGRPRYRLRLTDLGVEVASLFLGKPPTPEWLMDMDRSN